MSYKRCKYIGIILGFSFLLILVGCNDALNVTPASQLSAANYLATKKGVKAVLTQAYARSQRHGHNSTIQVHLPLVVTGLGYGSIGAWEDATLGPAGKWDWNSSMWFLNMYWNSNYDIIYNANVVLDHINNSSFSEKFRDKMKGQALSLRAYAYQSLYQWFGTVPMDTTTVSEDLQKPRATENQMKKRIENDYLNAAKLLPVDADEYRMTKGADLGLLARFYLNTKQWKKAAKYSKEVMDLGKYKLFPDYTTLFHIKNEGNAEIMWAQANEDKAGLGNTMGGLTYPPNFPFIGSQGAFPARVYVYDRVVNLYPSGDSRADSTVLMRSFIDANGKLIKGYPGNKTLPFKYGLDPNAIGGGTSGYDLPIIRYADVLMMRAEALNELNGPNTESITLINKVRERAGISDWNLSDFGSKKQLRDSIFLARKREFLFEPILSRIDMIRHGTFISNAKDRGISKADKHYLIYPIPQAELDANPNIQQNPGY
jgi:hypothetical protein